MPKARTGKIARLPLAIREELNRRLLDGQPASKLLPWLHSLPEVLKVLDDYFGEEPVSPQNLSEWRQGGFVEWVARRERIAQTKELSDYAMQLASAAGGSMTDGSAAIMGGKILEALESIGDLREAAVADAAAGEEGKAPAIDVEGLVSCLVALRRTDLEARKAAQRERQLEQKERQVVLAEKQFQVRTCELFLEWAGKKRAIEIAEGKGKKEVKIEQLRLLMFGAPPEKTT